MNEGWVASWIASGASPPAVAPIERTASEQRLQAALAEDWLQIVGWGTHVVVGDVLRFEAMLRRRRREVVAEVMSAVWDAHSRLYFGLFVLDGELAGQCILRKGREVYGGYGKGLPFERPWRLRWDNEAAREPAERAAHCEFVEAGRRYREARDPVWRYS